MKSKGTPGRVQYSAQVLDDGILTDGLGRHELQIIILTSNIGVRDLKTSALALVSLRRPVRLK